MLNCNAEKDYFIKDNGDLKNKDYELVLNTDIVSPAISYDKPQVIPQDLRLKEVLQELKMLYMKKIYSLKLEYKLKSMSNINSFDRKIYFNFIEIFNKYFSNPYDYLYNFFSIYPYSPESNKAAYSILQEILSATPEKEEDKDKKIGTLEELTNTILSLKTSSPYIKDNKVYYDLVSDYMSILSQAFKYSYPTQPELHAYKNSLAFNMNNVNNFYNINNLNKEKGLLQSNHGNISNESFYNTRDSYSSINNDVKVNKILNQIKINLKEEKVKHKDLDIYSDTNSIIVNNLLIQKLILSSWHGRADRVKNLTLAEAKAEFKFEALIKNLLLSNKNKAGTDTTFDSTPYIKSIIAKKRDLFNNNLIVNKGLDYDKVEKNNSISPLKFNYFNDEAFNYSKVRHNMVLKLKNYSDFFDKEEIEIDRRVKYTIKKKRMNNFNFIATDSDKRRVYKNFNLKKLKKLTVDPISLSLNNSAALTLHEKKIGIDLSSKLINRLLSPIDILLSPIDRIYNNRILRAKAKKRLAFVTLSNRFPGISETAGKMEQIQEQEQEQEQIQEQEQEQVQVQEQVQGQEQVQSLYNIYKVVDNKHKLVRSSILYPHSVKRFIWFLITNRQYKLNKKYKKIIKSFFNKKGRRQKSKFIKKVREKILFIYSLSKSKAIKRKIKKER